MNQLLDFGDDIELNGLALANATHSVGALSVVAKRHVLANSQHSNGVGNMLDIRAGGVDLKNSIKKHRT